MSKENMQTDELTFIQQQAYNWIVKLESGAMSEGDEERFVVWLEEDARHGEAFQQAEQAWKLMHQLTPDQVIEEPKPVKSTRAAMLPYAAALLLCFSALFWWQDVYFSVAADYYTHTGDQTKHSLADGSVITLNTGSAVIEKYSANQRLIELIKGEIYVDVATDPNRPFVVQTGELTVTALGTAFIVRNMQGEKPTITVTEHSVKVEADKAETLVVEQGQQVNFTESSNQFSAVKPVNVTRAASWTQGKYAFHDQSFEQVVTELSRYFRGKILIRDEDLKQVKVSGLLNVRRPVESLKGLEDVWGIEVTQMSPFLVLIEKG